MRLLAEQLMEQAEDEGTEAQAPEIKSVSVSEKELQSSSSPADAHKVQLQYHAHNKPASIPGMQGGEGEGSYTRTSRSQGTSGIEHDKDALRPLADTLYFVVQAAMIPHMQRMLGEAISELNLPKESTYRVADFGCAVGANTLSFAHFIAESLKKRCASQTTKTPEVQCFFADLPANDFNTLFQQLPVQHLIGGDHAANIDGESHEVNDGSRSYFAAGVPGSFYDRMFPCASLQIAISTYSLHWLSRVPNTVQDESLPTYNRGRVWIEGGSVEVAEEYAKVSRQDLHNFFRHRAQELVPGGLLFVQTMARGKRERPEEQLGPIHRRICPLSPSFEAAWDELIAQAVIEAEVRDSINIPVCFPSQEEIREAIEATSAFNIEQLQFREDGDSLPEEEGTRMFEDPQAFEQYSTNFTRSLLNLILEPYLGAECATKLFEVAGQKTAAEWAGLKQTLTKFPGTSYCVAVLVKK